MLLNYFNIHLIADTMIKTWSIYEKNIEHQVLFTDTWLHIYNHTLINTYKLSRK